MSQDELRDRCETAGRAVSALTLMRLQHAIASERFAAAMAGDLARAEALRDLLRPLETCLWGTGPASAGGSRLFLDLTHAASGRWGALAEAIEAEVVRCDRIAEAALAPGAAASLRAAFDAEFGDRSPAAFQLYVNELDAFLDFVRASGGAA